MNFAKLVAATRSVRRFHEDREVGLEALRTLTDLARQTGSAGNLQPLRYVLSNDPATNERIFSRLVWAAYLKDWKGPKPGERPAGYVVVCAEAGAKDANARVDAGIACQTMLLAAREKGLGGCMLGSVDRAGLRSDLDIPESVNILYVLAFGEPLEQVVLEPLGEDGGVKYWRDEKNVHHVPKRGLEQVILSTFERGKTEEND